MRTTTGLTLSPRETPQSVSVITKTQLDDQGLTTIEDALRTTTGVNVTRHGSRTVYQSRGFLSSKSKKTASAPPSARRA